MIDRVTGGGDTQNLCLVIPCFNEASRLDVASLRRFLDSGFRGHILFVDDGSRDNTLELLQQLHQGYKSRTAILPCTPNRGKGEAVRSGILHALDQFRPEIVGFWDADLATPLDTVERFHSVLESRPGIEMVFGSRVKLLGRDVRRRAARHYLGRVFATAASIILRLPIYDTQCGAKLFRVGPQTRQVFAEPFLSRWVFDVEIIARYLQLYDRDTKRLERVIYEYPLETWIDVAGSKVRPVDFFKAFWDIVKIREKYLS